MIRTFAQRMWLVCNEPRYANRQHFTQLKHFPSQLLLELLLITSKLLMKSVSKIKQHIKRLKPPQT